MRGRRRVRAIVVATIAVLLVAAGGVSAALLLRAPGAHAAAQATRVNVRSQAQAADQALRLLATDPGRLLPDDLRGTVQPGRAVPPHTTVDPHLTSWVSTGARSGTMVVTLTAGRTRTTYLAVMVEQSGSWRVLETEPLR